MDVTVVGGRLDAELSGGLAAWRGWAACRGVAPAVFFDRGFMARALQLCRSCPVAEPCLWWAMATEENSGYRFGIWGGTTPAVRARMATVVGPDYVRRRLQAAQAVVGDLRACLDGHDVSAEEYGPIR